MTTESVPLLLKVEKSKFQAFLEMLKLFEFVSVEPIQNVQPVFSGAKKLTKEQQEFAAGLREAINEAELDAKGIIQLPDARKLVQELKALSEI